MVLDLPRSLTGFGCMLIVVRLGLITFMREIEIEIEMDKVFTTC